MEINILTTIDKVEEIREEWKILLQKSLCNQAFSSPSWYINCCLYDNYKIPWVFTLVLNGNIKAIFPLIKTPENGILKFASQLSDYNDLIIAEDEFHLAVEFISQVLELLEEKTKVLLENLREDSLLYRSIVLINRRYYCNQKFKMHFEPSDVCFFVDTQQSYLKYISSKSPAFQKDIKRKRKKACREGFIIEEFKYKNGNISAIIESFLELHRSRIQDSILLLDNNKKFVENVTIDLILNGSFRVFLIRKENRIYAIQLSAQGKKTLGYWNGGFSKEIDSISPGKLLFDFQIVTCIKEGFDEFDLLRGDEAYKKSWCTKQRTVNKILIDYT